MPRKKNDGRGRLGGRAAGTPNSNPLKDLLRSHSIDYFTPSIPACDVELKYFVGEIKTADDERRALDRKAEFVANHKDEVFSLYQLDLWDMKAVDRAKLEVDLLAYHTAKMQAISADMNVKANQTLTDRLLRVTAGEDISADE